MTGLRVAVAKRGRVMSHCRFASDETREEMREDGVTLQVVPCLHRLCQ
jgi:hypothetical protein